MSAETRRPSRWLEWGAATLALPGQEESGDRYLVQPLPSGVLVAVVDGLGHGPEAAAAARIAIEVLERHADEALLPMVNRCHRALLPTRGVVLSMAAFHVPDGTMTWLAVGNVEGVLLRAAVSATPPYESVLLRGGVVGYQLPSLSATVLPVTRGDTLIFATDGIDSRFTAGLTRSDPPQQIADRILAEHRKATDDALVLVARYLGEP
jgi:negative regulator of sigma-B (phosphoserine phosphatase)